MALFIAISSIVISIFNLVKDNFLPAKVKIFFGDSLQIVNSDRNKIQINFNLINPRTKLSVINHLQATLSSPNGNDYLFKWNIFYKFDGHIAKPDRIPTSIAILPKNNVFQGIEFISDNYFTWVEGKYIFKIEGWFNRGMREDSNVTQPINFSLSRDDVDNLKTVRGQDIVLMRPVQILN